MEFYFNVIVCEAIRLNNVQLTQIGKAYTMIKALNKLTTLKLENKTIAMLLEYVVSKMNIY
ncbi:hypothetical protein [Candidatus Enterovibrio altilux]|uniref:hypothetical protein n=1 Tax=Candidatus Enterovibrio altilux TaxID=1927128 RepID=UPI000BBCC441|nr:hypothetical protein [Candidatus Enterovibrio luxaltus]